VIARTKVDRAVSANTETYVPDSLVSESVA
jgi:hypothetical protein